jgi:hypothetical protein
MPTPEELQSAKEILEVSKKERVQKFLDEFMALKERYPDVDVSFIIHDENALLNRIAQEIRASNKVMQISVKN